MTDFTAYTLYFNTAEIEAMYFNGETSPYVTMIKSFYTPTGQEQK